MSLENRRFYTVIIILSFCYIGCYTEVAGTWKGFPQIWTNIADIQFIIWIHGSIMLNKKEGHEVEDEQEDKMWEGLEARKGKRSKI